MPHLLNETLINEMNKNSVNVKTRMVNGVEIGYIKELMLYDAGIENVPFTLIGAGAQVEARIDRFADRLQIVATSKGSAEGTVLVGTSSAVDFSDYDRLEITTAGAFWNPNYYQPTLWTLEEREFNNRLNRYFGNARIGNPAVLSMNVADIVTPAFPAISVAGGTAGTGSLSMYKMRLHQSTTDLNLFSYRKGIVTEGTNYTMAKTNTTPSFVVNYGEKLALSTTIGFANVATATQVNVTNYNYLVFTGTFYSMGGEVVLGIEKTRGARLFPRYWARSNGNFEGRVVVDVSGLSGDYYLALEARNNASITVNSIMLAHALSY